MANKGKDVTEKDVEKMLRRKSVMDVEVPTKSLLDWKLDRKLVADDQKSLLHRMVIISKLFHQNFQEIGEHYEEKFKNPSNQFQVEGVTGLLLIYPRHCVHVIESSTEMLLEICKSLKEDAASGMGHMEKSKIVVISHDIPLRLYQQWSFRVLDIEAPRMEEYDSSDDAEKLISDMLTQLLKLGNYLSKQPTLSLKKTLDTLREKKPEFLPEQGAIGYLVESSEPCIMEPVEYISKYENPYDVVLGSEMVWPMPINLFPYN